MELNISECGKIREVAYNSLISGKVRSCGCLRRRSHGTHHMTGTRIYRIWRGINKRCYNKNDRNYYKYGERGITVCDEWKGRGNFINFYNWAMSHGYRDDLSIDRIDVNGNYEPSNCRWATLKEQMNNTRTNYFITYNGKTMTMAQWAEELGITYGAMCQRKHRGWSDEELIEGKRKHK